MKKLVFLTVLMFGFTYGLFGQLHPNKKNPGKRITDYASIDETQEDSTHYIYSTPFDAFASVILRKNVLLSTGSEYWSVDSIFYDAQNRRIMTNTYQRDSIGDYKIRFKRSAKYDDYAHSQILVTEGYSMAGELSYHNKIVKTYYSPEKIKQESYYGWDSTGWVLTQYRNYDEHGHVLEHTAVESLKFTYEYTSDGILLSEKLYDWDKNNNHFYTYLKTENKVVDGKIMISDTYLRGFYSGIWHHTNRTLYTYTPDGLKETEIKQHYLLGVLINDGKEEYAYDAQSRLKEHIHLKWDDALGFVKSGKDEYLYNDELRYQAKISSSWDTLSLDWKTQGKKIDYFAEDNTLDSTYYVIANNAGEEYRKITRIQFNADKTILEKTESEWDSDTNSWFTKSKRRWYYEDYEQQPIEKGPFVLSVFPNPAKEYITLGKGTMPDVDAYIYSASGQLMVTQNLLQTNKIYVGDWPKGVYYYVLVHNQHILSGSVLKL